MKTSTQPVLLGAPVNSIGYERQTVTGRFRVMYLVGSDWFGRLFRGDGGTGRAPYGPEVRFASEETARGWVEGGPCRNIG